MQHLICLSMYCICCRSFHVIDRIVQDQARAALAAHSGLAAGTAPLLAQTISRCQGRLCSAARCSVGTFRCLRQGPAQHGDADTGGAR